MAKSIDREHLLFIANTTGRAEEEVAKHFYDLGYDVPDASLAEPITTKRKIGGGGRAWVQFDGPKPPRVGDVTIYTVLQPDVVSDRVKWWSRQIGRGWRPNKRIRAMSFISSTRAAKFYGIYVWEFNNIIAPLLGSYEINPIRNAKKVRVTGRRR